jgi:hypothetical protein
MRRSRWLIPALLACVALPASAAWREVPYRDFHALFSRIEKLDGARYTRASAVFSVSEEAGVTLPELRLVIAAKGGDVEVPISDDGKVSFPISKRLYDENPPVRVNAAAGTLTANLSLSVEAPPRQRFPYQLVLDMDADYRAQVAEQGMLARLVMPDTAGLVVRFGPGPRGTATVGGPGGESFSADEKGVLTIPLRRKWRKPGVEVVLSRTPEKLLLLLE